MHPDYLPPRTALQRVSTGVVRVLLFPLVRLVWTAVLFALVQLAVLWLFPSIGSLSSVTLLGALRNALAASFALWASVHLLEGKRLSAAVGLSVRAGPLGFAKGFLLGAGLLTAVTGVLFLCGAYQVVGLGAGASPRALASAALLLLFVALFEEVAARGVVFRLLEQGLGTWAALALSALLFGYAHLGNPGATRVSSLAIALEAGVLFAAAYTATRSLWLPIGLHTAWNLFLGPVYGARVSGMELPSVLDADLPGPAWLTGGSFGPEAGLPAMVLGALLGVAFLVLAARRGQFFTPRWLQRLFRRGPALRQRVRTLAPSADAAPRPLSVGAGPPTRAL